MSNNVNAANSQLTRNIFIPINGRNEIEIHESHVDSLFRDLQRYSGLKGSTFYSKASEPNSDWTKRLIKNYLIDDSSRDVRILYENVFGSLNYERTIFVYELKLWHENEYDNNHNLRESITGKGSVESGGLYGLLHGLLEFTLSQSSKRMPRTNGSNNDGSVFYTVSIKRLREPNITMRDLITDQKLWLTNGTCIYLLTPDNEFNYCVPKILYHILFVQSRTKYKYLIQDRDYSVKDMIKILEKLQNDSKIMKRVIIQKLYKKGKKYFLKNIYGKPQYSKEDNWTTLVVDSKEQHVWILETPKKRPRVMDSITCILCNQKISKQNIKKHMEKCNHKKSIELENLCAKAMMYPVKEFTPETLEYEKSLYTTYLQIIITEILNGNSVFLSCFAGSGKTTLNQKILRDIPGKAFVVGPTGISISCYGDVASTWHSKFKWNHLGKDCGKNYIHLMNNPSLFKSYIEKNFKKNNNEWDDDFKEKPTLIIFEEASMMTGFDIKFISFILKIIYNDERDFGGIPVIFTGDPGQLPPIQDDEEFTDLYFKCSEIANIRYSGVNIALNYPFRLSLGISDPIELCNQANIQLKLRNGQLDPNLFNYLCKEDTNDFLQRCRNGDIERENAVVICMRNSTCYKVYLAITYNNGYEYVGKFRNGSGIDPRNIENLYIKIGCQLIVTDNWIVNSKEVWNGTICTVVDFKVDEWVRIRLDNGKEFKVRKHNGYGAPYNKGLFMLAPAIVRTSHKSQGETFENKVYIYTQGYSDPLYSNYKSGQLYTILSRCINMRNIVIICKACTPIQDCIKPSYLWCFEDVCRVIKDPKLFIPIDVICDNHKIKLRDTKSITGFIDVENVTIRDTKGRHKDCYIMENEKIYSNTIVYDIETISIDQNDNGIEILKTISICAIYYDVYGNPIDFKTVIQRNGGSIDDLGEYDITDTNSMLFHIWMNDDPMLQFMQCIRKLLYLVCDLIVFRNNTTTKTTRYPYKEIECLLYSPLSLVGFNNLGFDDRPLIKEFIMGHNSKYPLEEGFIHAGGSNLKGFTLRYENCVLLKSFDLFLMGPPSSLEKNLESSVLPFINQPDIFRSIHSILWKYGKDPDGNILSENWNEKTDYEKKTILHQFFNIHVLSRHFQGLNPKLYLKKEYIDLALLKIPGLIERCIAASNRDDLILPKLKEMHKKGTCPLKLINGKSTDEIRNIGIVDLIELMDDGNGNLNWNNIFYERDISKGKELLKEYGEEFMRNYDFKNELLSYNRADTFLTDKLLRTSDMIYYRFSPDSEEYKFKNSWAGMGISILNFSTITSATMSNIYGTIDKNVVYDGGNLKRIYLKFPKLPQDIINGIKGINGGRTMNSRGYFISNDWRQECLIYGDCSGMYCYAQIKSQYPFGAASVFTESNNNGLFQEYITRFKNKDYSLFDKVHYIKFRGHNHPNEIEPPGGVKKDNTLYYSNEQHVYDKMNGDMYWFMKFNGTIDEILIIVSFEHQSNYLAKPNLYYAEKKKNAKNKLEEKQYKSFANAGFGGTNQKDAQEETLICKNHENEYYKLLSEYDTGIKRQNFINDCILARVEKDLVLSQRFPVIGAVTLAESKKLIYGPLYIASGGEERLKRSNITSVLNYCDTDSLLMHQQGYKRIVYHDKQKLNERDKLLFQGGDDPEMKIGKICEELFGDLGDYLKPGQADPLLYRFIEKGDKKFLDYHSSLPNFEYEGYCRVEKYFSPGPKEICIQFRVPPTHFKDGTQVTIYNIHQALQEYEWHICFKCKIKGVSKNSTLRIHERNKFNKEDFDENVLMKKTGGIKHDKETFDLMVFAYENCLPIHCVKPEKQMKKPIFINDKEAALGISPFDLYLKSDVGKFVNFYPRSYPKEYKMNKKEFIMKPGFESKSIIEWVTEGYKTTQVFTGNNLPNGYNWKYSEESEQ